jgi:hypothetical protein
MVWVMTLLLFSTVLTEVIFSRISAPLGAWAGSIENPPRTTIGMNADLILMFEIVLVPGFIFSFLVIDG